MVIWWKTLQIILTATIIVAITWLFWYLFEAQTIWSAAVALYSVSFGSTLLVVWAAAIQNNIDKRRGRE